MNLKKSLATLLSAAMLFSMTAIPAAADTGTTGAAPASYSDMNGHWAEGAVGRWSGYGVVKGDNGAFRPDANMSVAELATVLDNLMGYTEKAENTFADLNGSEWYADAVLKCAAAGIIKGDGTNVGATAPINRERATVMMARALNIEPVSDPNLGGFTDGAAAADWSAGYIKAMADAGVVQGVGNGMLDLSSNINRASIMTIMDKSISDYITEGGTYEVKNTGITIVKAAAAVTLTGTAKDIIVAPASAEGSVTLDKATVSGTVTVNADNAQIVAKDATLADVAVNASGAAVDLQGESSAKSVVVTEDAAGAVLNVDKNAQVDNATLSASGTTTEISGTVKNIEVTDTASDAQIKVEKGATVTTVETAGEDTAITGNGTVKNVTVAEGTDAEVKTPNTVTTKTETTVDKDGNKVTVKTETTNNSKGEAGTIKTETTTTKPDGTTTTEHKTETPNKPSGGGGGGGSSTTTSVSTMDGLKAALANTRYRTITISGAIGDAANYNTYKVDRPVTIRGGTLYGTFTVTAEDVAFDGVTIYNQGDAEVSGNTPNTEVRNAINFYGDKITITGCTFELSGISGEIGIANGISIFNKSATVNYNVVGNTFKGYGAEGSGYSSSAFLVASGLTINEDYKEFFGVKGAGVQSPVITTFTTPAEKLILENEYEGCTNDFGYTDYTNPEKLVSMYRSISHGSNLLWARMAEGSQYYITGAVSASKTSNDSEQRTIPIGAEVTIVEGASLDIEEGATVTVNGTLTNNGTIVVGSAEALETALTSGGTVKLSADVAIDSGKLGDAWREKTVTLDLNQKTLTLNESGGSVFVGPSTPGDVTVNEENNCEKTDITLRNGTIQANNEKGTNANFAVEAGHALTFDGIDGMLNMSASGSAILVRGQDAVLNIKNSKITTTGTYIVTTNAADELNFGVKINISDSDLTTNSEDGDSCAVIINVPSEVNITGGSITGQRQALLVRSGDVSVTGTEIKAEIGQYPGVSRVGGAWGGGNEVDFGAVVVGKTNDTYQNDIRLKLVDCTISCTLLEGSTLDEKYCSAVFAIAKDTKYNVAVTMTDCKVLGGNVIDWGKGESDGTISDYEEILNDWPAAAEEAEATALEAKLEDEKEELPLTELLPAEDEVEIPATPVEEQPNAAEAIPSTPLIPVA